MGRGCRHCVHPIPKGKASICDLWLKHCESFTAPTSSLRRVHVRHAEQRVRRVDAVLHADVLQSKRGNVRKRCMQLLIQRRNLCLRGNSASRTPH